MEHTPHSLDPIAEQYVRCVLALGLYNADEVDAYYGPQSWKSDVEGERPEPEQIRDRAAGALRMLNEAVRGQESEMESLRRAYLTRQLRAVVARAERLTGARLSFDEECRVLYDASAPVHTAAEFEIVLAELGSLLPGEGGIHERIERFRSAFVIPPDRVDAVFRAAVEESRKRTLARIPIPSEESFSIEYVTGKSWSGYNWFRGNAESLIQISTDLPITIDRAIDLASHEGYPGHHVYNSLLERELLGRRGWLEFSVYALFTPQSMIAEGTANYGIAMAFPGEERVRFEQTVLYPLAGLDPVRAEQFALVYTLTLKLAFAGNEAARRYLDGTFTRDEAAEWLVRYALMSRDRAQQRTRFFDQYRSYVITYNVGQELVRRHIELCPGADDEAVRWKEFETLLCSPRLPSSLRR